jgi:hypothetical protein
MTAAWVMKRVTLHKKKTVKTARVPTGPTVTPTPQVYLIETRRLLSLGTISVRGRWRACSLVLVSICRCPYGGRLERCMGIFCLIRRSHSIRFTGAQSIPKNWLGCLGMRKSVRTGDVYLCVCLPSPQPPDVLPCQEHHSLPTLCFNVHFPFLVSHPPPHLPFSAIACDDGDWGHQDPLRALRVLACAVPAPVCALSAPGTVV